MWLRMAVSKFYPNPFDPFLGDNCQTFKFRNNLGNCQYFAEILHTGRAAIFMKHIKGDFSLNAWAQSPRVYLVGGTEAKINLFSEYGYVAYHLTRNVLH